MNKLFWVSTFFCLICLTPQGPDLAFWLFFLGVTAALFFNVDLVVRKRG